MSVLDFAKMLLVRWNTTFSTPDATRLDVKIEPSELSNAVSALLAGHWGYLAAITGLDEGDALEVLYHFCNGGFIVTFRVSLPRIGGSVTTICRLIPAAGIFEREISEMFGVTFKGAPDTTRLFLPDDWEEGVYPLLKDAVITEQGHERDD